MLIRNQDHDITIQKTEPVTVEKHYYNGHFCGYNLYHGKTLLGTFDTGREAKAQRWKIEHWPFEKVTVSGYDGEKEMGWLTKLVRDDDSFAVEVIFSTFAVIFLILAL